VFSNLYSVAKCGRKIALSSEAQRLAVELDKTVRHGRTGRVIQEYANQLVARICVTAYAQNGTSWFDFDVHLSQVRLHIAGIGGGRILSPVAGNRLCPLLTAI
jgi:hypothetical protein